MNEPSNVPTNRPLPPEMQAWLYRLPQDQRAELELTWRIAGRGEPSSPSRSGAAWARVLEAIETEETSSRSLQAVDRASARRSSRARWRYVALPLLTAILACVALLYWLRPVTVTAPVNEVLSVLLPDGSAIRLSSQSSLEYRRGLFGARRGVSLRGEAFFDVVEDVEPFIIETSNAEVTVLGTRFNVRAHPVSGIPVTSVVLETGSVRLASKGEAQPIMLRPGQQSLVSGMNAPTAPTSVDVKAALAWLEGGLAFFGQPVGAVLDEVERRYGTRIVAPVDVRQDTVSIYLPRIQSAEAALTDLCAFLGCTYRPAGAAYVIER